MIYLLMGTNFEETEAMAPVDAVRRAGGDILIVGIPGKSVTSSHGVTINTDITLDEVDLEKATLIVLPGGKVTSPGNYGYEPAALELIKKAYEKNIPIAAICAGPTVLGGLGMLKGRTAICYPGMEQLMTGATVAQGCRVVKDGNIITAQGPGTAIEFGLNVAAFAVGREAAEKVRLEMHYPEINYAVL